MNLYFTADNMSFEAQFLREVYFDSSVSDELH